MEGCCWHGNEIWPSWKMSASRAKICSMEVMKWLWENSCKICRHTKHLPEHVEGRQGHTERPQQSLLFANKGSFSENSSGAISVSTNPGLILCNKRNVESNIELATAESLQARRALLYWPWHEYWTSVWPVLGAALRSERWRRVLMHRTCWVLRKVVSVQQC